MSISRRTVRPYSIRRARMGLEGIVSKRLDKPYRSGRSGDWIKTKNPDSPAMQRHRQELTIDKAEVLEAGLELPLHTHEGIF